MFQHSFCRKTPKKLKGVLWGKVFFRKKVATRGVTLWSRPVLYVTRETFLVQFIGPTGAIQNFVELLVELFRNVKRIEKIILFDNFNSFGNINFQ